MAPLTEGVQAACTLPHDHYGQTQNRGQGTAGPDDGVEQELAAMSGRVTACWSGKGPAHLAVPCLLPLDPGDRSIMAQSGQRVGGGPGFGPFVAGAFTHAQDLVVEHDTHDIGARVIGA